MIRVLIILDAMAHEHIAGSKKLEEIKHIGSQLASALQHMHAKGVLHGDLKPLNVMRVAGKWKLIDFDAAVPLQNRSKQRGF